MAFYECRGAVFCRIRPRSRSSPILAGLIDHVSTMRRGVLRHPRYALTFTRDETMR